MVKFKLDEHFGKRLKSIFLNSGYDAETVRDENLQGVPDIDLFDVCKKESRCLITLDLDFSDVIRFSPWGTGGIVILRPRKRITVKELENLTLLLLKFIESNPVKNQLWVVEKNKIRIHKPDEDYEFQ